MTRCPCTWSTFIRSAPTLPEFRVFACRVASLRQASRLGSSCRRPRWKKIDYSAALACMNKRPIGTSCERHCDASFCLEYVIVQHNHWPRSPRAAQHREQAILRMQHEIWREAEHSNLPGLHWAPRYAPGDESRGISALA